MQFLDFLTLRITDKCTSHHRFQYGRLNFRFNKPISVCSKLIKGKGERGGGGGGEFLFLRNAQNACAVANGATVLHFI